MTNPQNLPSSLRDTQLLTSPEGVLYASDGENYGGAIFGRDSLESAEDLLGFAPEFAMSTVMQLARLQGTERGAENEEEPGKISHEHRQRYIDGREIPYPQLEIFEKLSRRWGGTEDEVTYYGSVDATPLYGRLLARLAIGYGPAIFSQTITNKRGETVSLLDSFVAAADWLADKIDSSETGLIEFQRTSERGLIVQAWKDSASAYVHIDGSPASTERPIAPLEVQGYAFDALTLAGVLADRYDIFNRGHVERWKALAAGLQQRTLDLFWDDHGEQFVMGLDRDEYGQVRQIKTPSSNQGLLLDTQLFDGLRVDEKAYFVSSIARNLIQPDFVTDVGIRCRSAAYADIVDFQDYHGSWAVWVKETYDIAKGLHRHGFDQLAQDLEVRILNGVNLAGNNYEFLFAAPDGAVDYWPQYSETADYFDRLIVATTLPEPAQAWTVSAVRAIKHRRLSSSQMLPWQLELTDSLRAHVPPAQLLRTAYQIERARMGQAVKFAIDTEAGLRADRRWNPDWWG